MCGLLPLSSWRWPSEAVPTRRHHTPIPWKRARPESRPRCPRPTRAPWCGWTQTPTAAPAGKGPVVHDRDEVPDGGSKRPAESEQPRALWGRQPDDLRGHARSQHLVLGLEELDLPPEIILGGAGEGEQQPLEVSGHTTIVAAMPSAWARTQFMNTGRSRLALARVLTRSLERFEFGKTNPVVNPKRERATFG